MSKKSSSKSTISTITEQYDQRTVAENAAVVIGTGASVDVDITESTSIMNLRTDEFSDNVASAFDALIDFASEAGAVAMSQVGKSQEALVSQVEKSQEVFASQTEKSQGLFAKQVEKSQDVLASQVGKAQDILSGVLSQKQTGIPSSISQILPYMAIGLFAIAGLVLLKRKK